MGQARNAAADRAKRGHARGGKRRASANADARTDAADGVSAGERLDAEANGALLGNGGLAAADEADETNYRRLRLKAERALSVLIDAPGVPPNVRSAAIRTALELVGAIGVRSKDQRNNDEEGLELDPERLTVEEIDREIHKLGRV